MIEGKMIESKIIRRETIGNGLPCVALAKRGQLTADESL